MTTIEERRVTCCPLCGVSLEQANAFVQEFWSELERHFFCWCPQCGGMCTVSLSERVVSHEPEH